MTSGNLCEAVPCLESGGAKELSLRDVTRGATRTAAEAAAVPAKMLSLRATLHCAPASGPPLRHGGVGARCVSVRAAQQPESGRGQEAMISGAADSQTRQEQRLPRRALVAAAGSVSLLLAGCACAADPRTGKARRHRGEKHRLLSPLHW